MLNVLNETARRVEPDELTAGFSRVGLRKGSSLMMHATLESMGTVEGGAAMVIHRLLGVIGKEGTLLMPTFTSISRHSLTHDDFKKPGCWCESKEDRHVPFIPELQPDKEIGAIAHRLCSWPSSRRSRHPAYSYAAVGQRGDEVTSERNLLDPLLPVRKILKHDPLIVTIGANLNVVTAIHLAEESNCPKKFARERALTVSSKGQEWVDVNALGCSKGFWKLKKQFPLKNEWHTKIGLADVEAYRMKELIKAAETVLVADSSSLNCDNASCLSCNLRP